ncbi:hypothetical protein A8C56_02095 [Niabella ginsenosidivorans]|uniref:Uncharacterized protein n=1 Tax=Niabella ginsenosidivorans TaxID=1176587 RepID=A0A1A9HX18_9BACT|nr:hypothetical protein [Niabella ginsenosidivorans]ANH79927.1 hypothetical protein A8C56_02095 [Niabella ginsenosidivorans]
MLKTFLLSTIFVLVIGGVSYANEDPSVNFDRGKEKSKSAYFSDSRFNGQLNSFSLRSKYQFRGDKLLTNESSNNNYVNLNTSISYQKGQNTYIVPYKKKVVLNRFTFNPNETLRNYSK